MESHKPNPKPKQEKGWLEKGKDLFDRAVGNEEDAVKKFLDGSPNYKKLLDIVKTSRESKAKTGIFGGNSIFQKVLYQISPGEEEMFDKLQHSKTFYELFHNILLKSEIRESPYAEPILNKASSVIQEAHASLYWIYLAKEIKEFANSNFYSLEANNSPQYTYK